MKIRPVILSGGSGTRLWPVSRSNAPKQFVPLTTGGSLFGATLQSISDTSLFLPPLIVANTEHRFLIKDALKQSQIVDCQLILEPVGRNTAAAAIAAALKESCAETLHLIRPSDHLISDLSAWNELLQQAIPAAKSGSIVLFGITPTYPETGYGYIQPDENMSQNGVYRIVNFKEKPEATQAANLIAKGALWNSGIFLYAPNVLLNEARRLAPDLVQTVEAAIAGASGNGNICTLDAKAYSTLPTEPFDRVIMEHTCCGAVLRCAVGWNDAGSWQALWQIASKDTQGNAVSGPAILEDTNNSYIRSEGPAVAILGMQNVAVIATKDAILVTQISRAQDVKKVFSSIESAYANLTKDHPLARRPWGSYEGIAHGSHFQVKHITVLPGRSLSLQMHYHRAEHWVVVAGTALIECNDEKKLVYPNESVYIPKGARHRLINPGLIELHLIEVQSGDYLGEDDIVRFADEYGRECPARISPVI